MIRSIPENKKMPATASETKYVRLELPVDTHLQLRVMAAKQGMSMAEYTRHLVEQHVRSKGKPKGSDQ